MDSSGNPMYDSYLFEIRPTLQSVNVFIKFKSGIDVSKLVVQFVHNELYITYESRQLTIAKCFDIKEDSFTRTYCKNNYLCFRYCTNLKKDCFNGSFGMEMLNINNEVTEKRNLPKAFLENLYFDVEQTYTIKCNFCQSKFCNNVSFERILPLPTDGCDSSDWFCHDDRNKERGNLYSNCQNMRDLFYSDAHVYIHKNILNNYLEEDNICCKVCLKEIGIKKRNTDIFKFWNHKVIFENNNGKTLKSEPLTDLLKTIINFIKDPLRRTTKVVINTSFNGSHKYILLWIMEKSLKVLLSIENRQNQHGNLAKVLFLHMEEENDLVNEWLDNIEVFNIDVSDEMLLALKEHLIHMSNYMPPEFVKSLQFNVSYLNMYNNF